jgi:hypothetical protein
MKLLVITSALTGSLAIVIGSASADVLKATTFSGDAVGSTRALLPLNGSNATAINFDIPGKKSERIAITYTAHCGVEGPVLGFVDIDIEVDDVEIPPTNVTGDIFCSADATSAIDSWVHASIIGIKTLEPGQHKVEVYATATQGALSWQLGSSTLLIQE